MSCRSRELLSINIRNARKSIDSYTKRNNMYILNILLSETTGEMFREWVTTNSKETLFHRMCRTQILLEDVLLWFPGTHIRIGQTIDHIKPSHWCLIKEEWSDCCMTTVRLRTRSKTTQSAKNHQLSFFMEVSVKFVLLWKIRLSYDPRWRDNTNLDHRFDLKILVEDRSSMGNEPSFVERAMNSSNNWTITGLNDQWRTTIST